MFSASLSRGQVLSKNTIAATKEPRLILVAHPSSPITHSSWGTRAAAAEVIRSSARN